MESRALVSYQLGGVLPHKENIEVMDSLDIWKVNVKKITMMIKGKNTE